MHNNLSPLFWLQNDARWWLELSLNTLSLAATSVSHPKTEQDRNWSGTVFEVFGAGMQTDMHENLN